MKNDARKSSSKAPDPGRDPLIGSVLGGRYRIDTLLGSGAMGRVYAAEHVLMHKPLAVKVLHAEHTARKEIVARFEREATAAANIDHPNVVAATDFGTLTDGTVYLALELVQGKSLRAEVAAAPLGVRRSLHIARQVASGLAAAHARNIVHRDLKPENVILVEKNGDPDFVKVLDFGIAKVAMESGTSPLTKVGMVLGTRDYMAPEQGLGQPVDHRADLYSLGVLMYEMLCRECPFEGESQASILGLQLTKPPPSLRKRAPTLDIPPSVEALVMKLLAKERTERPESAATVVAELDRLIASLGGSRPAGAPKTVPRVPAAAPPRPAPSARPPAPSSRAPAPVAPPPVPAPRAVPSRPAPPSPPAVPSPFAPVAPVVQKPTFLPSDPLPSFTFPPLEDASKELHAKVQQAAAARAADRAALESSEGPAGTAVAPAWKQGLERASARALELLRALGPRATHAFKEATFLIDDNRRLLPAFIRRPLRRVPAAVILVGLFVFLVLVVVVIGLLVAGPGDDEPKDASRTSSVSATPLPSAAPSVAPAATSAARGVEAVALAEKELKAGNLAAVVKAIEEALEADPAVRDSERVAAILGEAARRSASSSAAFRLLTGPMRVKGAEVVYDLAAGTKTPEEVRTRAETWLASDAFRSVAPPPLAIAGELRTTRGCKDKRALLERAATTGDQRALDYLKILAVKGGCGRRGREDCFPCLRDDDTLSKTIATIEARLGKSSKAP
jgi:serine/threonine-protein kinase